MASSLSRPAGRKKTPQGATGPSTLNVPKEKPSPANEHSQRFKNGSKLPISESRQETAGHSLSLPKFFNCGKKDFSGPLSRSCDFLTEKARQ
ncbi:hypothetical protein AVEN_241284-1 [Araneus ventricosus]|uniref:Uncharacterized protein n=1 Tax=Araneus ventricosus TaxID=182803 RepID=A0A4Y2JG40_ARAVE|nr:hypothetical protein AVEN_241284-1 [Araneus ventricosus]